MNEQQLAFVLNQNASSNQHSAALPVALYGEPSVANVMNPGDTANSLLAPLSCDAFLARSDAMIARTEAALARSEAARARSDAALWQSELNTTFVRSTEMQESIRRIGNKLDRLNKKINAVIFVVAAVSILELAAYFLSEPEVEVAF